MSASVLPSLSGFGWPWVRSPIFSTRRQVSVSGKETRIRDWSTPRYQWTLAYNFLRQGTNGITSFSEFSQLEGFFETLGGGWDSFLFADPDDFTVSSQAIATGNGVTTVFQLQRSFGGATAIILAPNTSTTFNVYLNGVLRTPVTDYTVSSWGSAVPGCITFTGAPGSGVVITADFSYYFPVRFDDDTLDFSKFLSYVYELKKVSFTSIK